MKQTVSRLQIHCSVIITALICTGNRKDRPVACCSHATCSLLSDVSDKAVSQLCLGGTRWKQYQMEVNNEIMEIVSFEKRTFEEMAAKLDYFVQRMDDLCRQHGEKKAERWMDSHAVCRKLRISPRTLQTLRDNGTLAFTKIGNRTYYRQEDVERVIVDVEERRKEAKWKGKSI